MMMLLRCNADVCCNTLLAVKLDLTLGCAVGCSCCSVFVEPAPHMYLGVCSPSLSLRVLRKFVHPLCCVVDKCLSSLGGDLYVWSSSLYCDITRGVVLCSW